MLDIITTRVQEICFQQQQQSPPSQQQPLRELQQQQQQPLQDLQQQQKEQVEPDTVTANNSRLSFTGLRRMGYHERSRRRQLIKDNIRKTYNDLPFQIKQVEWNVFWGKTGRLFPGVCCSSCTRNSQSCYVTEATKSRILQNVLQVDAQQSTNGYFTRKFCHFSTVWQLKAYEYQQVSSLVLEDERIKKAIQVATQKDLNNLPNWNTKTEATFTKQHAERASKILKNMRSTLSDFLLRLTSWILYKLLPCFLTKVVTHSGQLEMLHAASQSGLPLIFLPLHRSHLDYILISFILLNNNIKSPLVAAGDNLRIPVFGWLLRGLGAFFIKRRIDPMLGQKDIMYRAVLHTYMMQCLRGGHNMEFFIEGGRSRTGKPSLPKGGLLSVIVDAYMDGTIEDALLVPVSLNYEKLVDGNYVRELLGQPKQMETFMSAVKGIWSVLNSNYGMIRIDFNQPFSLRELVHTFMINTKNIVHIPKEIYREDALSDTNRNSVILASDKELHTVPSSASLFGTDIVDEKQRLLVESIARHVLYDATLSTSIMSTNAIAFLLLSKFRAGTTLSNLVSSLETLHKELSLEKRDVGFTGEYVDIIHNALELLGPGLVKSERKKMVVDGENEELTTFIRPITMLPNIIELSYYSNTVLLFYVMDSVVVTGLHSLFNFSKLFNTPDMKNNGHHINQEKLVQAACEVCDILQFEFIFTKPCQQLETAIMDKIDNLRVKDILQQNIKQYSPDEERSQRFARYVEYDSSEEESPLLHSVTEYSVNAEKDALRHLEFYHGLLRHLIDTYVASAFILERLVGKEITEKQLIQDILAEVKMQLDNGMYQYGESLSVDPIKNSLRLFERWGILECCLHENIKIYYLQEDSDNAASVRTVYNKIKKFKWEVDQ